MYVCESVCVCVMRGQCHEGARKRRPRTRQGNLGGPGAFGPSFTSVCVCVSVCDSLMSSSTLRAAMFAGRRACFYQLFSSLNTEKRFVRLHRRSGEQNQAQAPHKHVLVCVFAFSLGLFAVDRSSI